MSDPDPFFAFVGAGSVFCLCQIQIHLMVAYDPGPFFVVSDRDPFFAV